MPLPRHEVAAYHRARRARLKTERKAAVRADTALPPDAILRASEGEIAVVKADIAAIRNEGGRALITKVGGRLRAVDTSRRAIAPSPVRAIAPSPARTITPPTVRAAAPPPRSMFAVGGKPGRGLIPQGPGYAAPPDLAAVSQFTRFQENTAAMLGALAARADAQDRRIAVLEAQAADRKAVTSDFAQALFALARAAFIGG